MKKLLVLVAVLAMAVTANATVIDVAVDGVGSLGNAGTLANPLESGESIDIVLVLNYTGANHPTYPSYGSYNGYVLSGMNLELATTNTSGLSKESKAKNMSDAAQWAIAPDPSISGSSFLTGEAAGNLANGGVLHPEAGGALTILWGMTVTADGNGDIVITPTNAGPGGQYSLYLNKGLAAGDLPDPAAPWIDLANGDLGAATIYVNSIPEPMTLALLGLGGLFLRRRK